MPTLILPCAKCQASTLHRTPKNNSVSAAELQQYLQCEACGAMRTMPEPAADQSDVDALDAVGLMDSLPAMSQKAAHSKLEDLLYEHRAAIEESEAYCSALGSADAADYELHDIKVQKYSREQTGTVVEFTFYALGEGAADPENRNTRIRGSGSGRIDGTGKVEIQGVTAAPSDS